ncbi:hypothetical protein [Hymenobacter terrenus]|uniref:hypothetical protein n=1 Tax=Hymenobacter terrenus TaxID=1629124 RepID=UPI000619603C|nr:hypothetical protein [Hymenobacter terrenus]
MKKHIFAVLLAISALGATSCNKDPKLPTPDVEEFPQIYTNITAQSTYKVSEIQGGANPTATVNLDVRGGDANKVEAIEIFRQARTFNVPATGNATVGQSATRVLLKAVPPVSGDIQIPLSEMIAGLTRPTGASQTGTRVAITPASLKANEGFFLTYGLLLKGGRRIAYNTSFLNAPFSGVVNIVP